MTQETADNIKARQEALSSNDKPIDLPPPQLPDEEDFRKAQIDFSKIKNVEALKVMDRDGAKIVSENTKRQKRSKNKFSFFSAIEFELPSHGKFYQDSEDSDVANGIIRMRPMGLKEEEIMTNQVNLKSGTAIAKVFDSCMESNYPAEELLTFDSTYLLYALRKATYGDEYRFMIKCPDCEREFEESVNISDLSFAEIPDDIEEPIVIKLPQTGYTVTMCLPRLRHSEQLYRFSKDNEDVSEKVLNFTIQTISIKDPKGKEVSPADYIEFYESIPAADRVAITEKFKFDTGIEKVTFICQNPKCAKEFKEVVPMTLSFFRLD